MATRSQERERKPRRNARIPGIYRGHLAPEASEAQVDHGVRGAAISGRAISGLIVCALSIVLVLMFTTSAFYVDSASIAGARYLDERDVFAASGIQGSHVLAIDPVAVSQQITGLRAVAAAEVTVGWPPTLIRIRITEREPAVIWNQAGEPMWVDIHGNVLMSPREERADLLQIDAENIEVALHPNETLQSGVVDGARQLRELIPNTNRLRYHQDYGLGFTDPAGWDAWFGSGLDMRLKILIYRTLVEDLNAKGIRPSLISVISPDSPFYCTQADGC
jgi:cell division septal protein FtsQ